MSEVTVTEEEPKTNGTWKRIAIAGAAGVAVGGAAVAAAPLVLGALGIGATGTHSILESKFFRQKIGLP